MTEIKIDNSKEIEYHEKLKKYSIYPYHPEDKSLLGGAKVIDEIHNKSGLDAYIIKTSEGIVVSFKGSEELKDFCADIVVGTKHIPKQLKEAYELCKYVKEKYAGYNITITGHSLGGGEGAYGAAKTGLPAVVFNPVGTAELIAQGEFKDDSRIINYCNPRDWVPSGQKNQHLGICYEVNSKGFTAFKEKGVYVHHNIEDMENLRTRKLTTKSELMHKYNEYEKTLPKYVGIAVEALKDTFGPVYNFANSCKEGVQCAGKYWVSGYTREDGAKVEGYERTCGAKHLR